MFFFRSHSKNLKRWFIHSDSGWFNTYLEVPYNRSYKAFGFSVKFRPHYSEYPFTFWIGFGFISFFFGLRLKGLNEIINWLCFGHKRTISWEIHNGAIWWKLWFEDDGGHDDHHRCDPWRKLPLLKKKYRPWLCLRHGHIPVNPLDVLWGPRRYWYTDVQKSFWVVDFGGPDDERTLELTLQSGCRRREFGPKWAEGFKDEGWFVEWKCEEGIPFRNDSWKGDCVYASGLRVNTREEWQYWATEALKVQIANDRKKHGYVHPGHDARKR